eukprot:12028627-Alexandrium_andersonii.AAC.1
MLRGRAVVACAPVSSRGAASRTSSTRLGPQGCARRTSASLTRGTRRSPGSSTARRARGGRGGGGELPGLRRRALY